MTNNRDVPTMGTPASMPNNDAKSSIGADVGVTLRVGHFSDLHYCEKNLVESDRCFGDAIEQAIRQGVDVAVVSGDATDHALDVHNPAVERLARRVLQLAQHCPVLLLQGTYSHEPPGTLSIFRLLGARHPVHVADRIEQVALQDDGTWCSSTDWRFDRVPDGARALFTCVPTVNKANLAIVVGAAAAGVAQGEELAALLAGYAAINDEARRQQLPTIGVSHGTVSGCVTEHGVPMAGFDHEFTTNSLFAAKTQAFMLGHIHRHQVWQHEGRLIAYAGSIGRFHHGEIGDKGFVLWDVGAVAARCVLRPTPARRTVDLLFDGKPDLQAIEDAVREQQLIGAFVRVRWVVEDECREAVDRAAIRRALAGAADIQLEGRIVPIVRSRAAGISRCASLPEKLRTWARLTSVDAEPLLVRLARLQGEEPAEIAAAVLTAPAAPPREAQRAVTNDEVRPPAGASAESAELDLFS